MQHVEVYGTCLEPSRAHALRIGIEVTMYTQVRRKRFGGVRNDDERLLLGDGDGVHRRRRWRRVPRPEIDGEWCRKARCGG